jgi:hypothetical protein
MPSWSDEDGRCCFVCEDGEECHRSAVGCPAHAPPPLRPSRPKGKIFWGTARFNVVLVTKRGPRNVPVSVESGQIEASPIFRWLVGDMAITPTDPVPLWGEALTFEEAVRAGRLAAEKLLREINK